jgi:uncharacterized protein (DUF362 family)
MLGRVYVLYGDKAEEMALQVMQRMEVAKEVAALGKKRPLIGIKPNLVVAQPAAWGATTEPGLVRGVIRYLKEEGFANIVIMEGSWLGDCTKKAFRECGYEEIGREFDVPLVDLKKDRGVKAEAGGLQLEVCGRVLAVDYLVNMPVLKAHCQTRLTCALKNLKGCIPDREKKRFHDLGLHKPIACLAKVIRPALTVVDGMAGDLVYEGGGNPVRLDRVIAGRDPVAVDAYAAGLLGYAVRDIPYIGLAEELGVGSARLGPGTVAELNKGEGSRPDLKVWGEADHLLRHIEEDGACSPCFGGLVHALLRLKEKGKLARLPGRVRVGQGYRGKGGEGFGVGECAGGYNGVGGCPPKASEMVVALEEWIGEKK